MKKTAVALVIVLIICLFSGCEKNKTKFTDYTFDYFDTATTIIGYEKDKKDFDNKCREIKAELEKYHRYYDIYNSYAGINNLYTVNSRHIEVEVGREIIDLLQFSKDMYAKSNGEFNIAMGSVLKIWHNYRNEGIALPNEALLKQASEHINIEDIVIYQNKVVLRDSEMLLDVGAVAKGYSVEKVAEFMKAKGYGGYILNVGGNVCTIGENPNGKEWSVAIENPDKLSDKAYAERLELAENMSLVTSGSYQRFYTVNGKNYHHIIDADTLYPAEYFSSVSVLSESSAVADVLSTTLFCMSYEDGLRLLEQFENVEVMWINADGTKLYTKGFKNYCVD